MTWEEYQSRVNLTAVYPKEHAIPYLLLGLTGEAGEVANKYKKILRGDFKNKPDQFEAQVNMMIEELGDTLWYIAELCNQLNVTLGLLMHMNLEKLSDRYNLRASVPSYDDQPSPPAR